MAKALSRATGTITLKDFIAFPNVGRPELEYVKYAFLPVDAFFR